MNVISVVLSIIFLMSLIFSSLLFSTVACNATRARSRVTYGM